MQRLFARATGAAAVVVCGLFAVVAPASAQTDPVTTTGTPNTAAGATTTTIACPVFAGPDAQFVGTATDVGDVVARFHIDRIDAGAIAVENVEVDFPDDARFLKAGTQYRVPVLRDAESDRFVSKVRPLAPDRGGVAEECAKRDPVVTTLADGKSIETGVFSGLRGRSGRAAWAFVLPTICALAALIVLVIIKRLLWWTFNRVAGAERRP